MSFPIRCNCNNVIGGKWLKYLELVEEGKKEDGRKDDTIPYLTKTTTKTAEGRAMDKLGIKLECCRRMFLTHVELF